MSHPTDWPGTEAAVPARSGLLSATLRRDLTDLNSLYLDLGLATGAEDDPRFGWAEPIRARLRSADADTLARLATVPFALFDLVLPVGPAAAPAARVEDGRPVTSSAALQGRCESFAHQAAFLARRLVEGRELAAGVVFALAPEARRWLLECRPLQVADLVLDPASIRPRWRWNVHFWETLVAAAGCSSPAALEWAHCIGLCLIGAADDPPASLPAKRRPRR